MAYHDFQETYGNDEVVVLAVHDEDGIIDAEGIALLRELGSRAEAVDGIAEATSIGTELTIDAGSLFIDIDRLVPEDLAEVEDWEAQRAIYLDGASFVSPARVGLRPEGVDEASFLSDFREFVLEGPYAQTGFHERIVGLRVDTFGGIAHAFVAFEGFRPGEGETVSRGLDSIQFVRDGGAWRLVSFTTQYEGPDLSMPGRFLVGPRD